MEFWIENLGFKETRRMEESGPTTETILQLRSVVLTTVKLSDSLGNVVELLKFHSHEDKPQWSGHVYSTGLTHIALSVVDLEEEYRRLSASGVTFFDKPQTSVDGKVKSIYCSGPEGLLLELVEEITPQ